jgi:hypothetical protein
VAVSLTVERARNMPLMDLGRGADVFCAAFIDGGDDELGTAGGNRLFQTRVRRGAAEADWTWDEVSEAAPTAPPTPCATPPASITQPPPARK